MIGCCSLIGSCHPQERVSLARQIEKIEYFNSKTKQQNSWLQQAADALEMDMDDDLMGKTAGTHTLIKRDGREQSAFQGLANI